MLGSRSMSPFPLPPTPLRAESPDRPFRTESFHKHLRSDRGAWKGKGKQKGADQMLRGVRVLEFAGLAPAPFAGLVLQDLGAEVIRVDRTHGAQDVDALGR